MTFWKGFRVLAHELFQPTVTNEYPAEKNPKSPASTAATSLTATTTAWSAASAASSAPASAPPTASTSGGPTTRPTPPVSPGERYGYVYEINDLRCIHCDLCVEAYPTEAIVETPIWASRVGGRGGG